MGSNVKTTPPPTTTILLVVVLPAASVAVKVSQLVPGANGMFSAQKLPFRSTMALISFVSPLVSTAWTLRVEVNSLTLPRQVKLLPPMVAPAWGQKLNASAWV
jgi:hypothetical protein